jgi:hypothetical protein
MAHTDIKWRTPWRRAQVVALLSAIAIVTTACPSPDLPRSATDRKGRDDPAPPTGPTGIVDYAPGLRIDYRRPRVEVDAEVILREADLELFAYSRAPTPKEHETILRTDVSATRIYEALGLIGLAPGHTMKYFPETKTVRMPEGDPVDVLVRYLRDGKTVESSACDWMWDVAADRPMGYTPWLFTGSQRMEDGAFYADYEGTIVTVVDFPSSLLSLPVSHSSSDDALWLRANTAAIPPIGTKVTMILRPAAP